MSEDKAVVVTFRDGYTRQGIVRRDGKLELMLEFTPSPAPGEKAWYREWQSLWGQQPGDRTGYYGEGRP